MSEFRIDQITNQAGTAGPQVAGITTFSSTSGLLMASGPTEYRGGRGRGLISNGGAYPTPVNTIDYITISTAGNALDFGDTTQAREGAAMVASSVRGISAGGGVFGTPIYNILDYITISSTGNAFDFGDLTTARRETAGVSNSTRGIIAGGYFDSPIASDYTTIDYVTIASLGNASFFGDLLTKTREIHCGLCNSTTRGIFGGGNSTPVVQNTIQFLTISTLGNTQDFGDLTSPRRQGGACSSSIRGIFGGSTGPTNIIDYITIASTGDAIDFGDLTQSRLAVSGLSNQTRGVFAGGYIAAPAGVNTIDFVTIASIGNASDFGDLSQSRGYTGACSDAHGGLGD